MHSEWAFLAYESIPEQKDSHNNQSGLVLSQTR